MTAPVLNIAEREKAGAGLGVKVLPDIPSAPLPGPHTHPLIGANR